MGRAARLFNGSAEQTLSERLTPSSEQREFLQEQWNGVIDLLKAEIFQRFGYEISTWIQGSYKFGTLIKPIHKGGEYDVDVGLYFESQDGSWERPLAGELRDLVQVTLKQCQNKIPNLRQIETPPKNRCSRLSFDKKFHIDLPIYWLERSADSRRLAVLPNKWEDSDPKEIYLWFKSCTENPERDQLRRLVRYLKGWVAVAFSKNLESRPSSIFITVLVATCFSKLDLAARALDDEDALISVIRYLYARLITSRVVLNPVNTSEDLNRIPDRYWPNFLEILERLHNAVQKAEESENEMGAALAWAEAFSFLMPLPALDEIEHSDDERSLVILPNIEIEVFARNPKRPWAKHQNEVPLAAKDCDLKFRIANPHVVPPLATVEWIVRNAGREAEAIGDLGHTRGGNDRCLEAFESTAYIGKHYMDCIVRLGGQIIALRRVPVTIGNYSVPLRNAPNPLRRKPQSLNMRR